MTVLVINTSKQIGDKDHVKLCGKCGCREKWFEENGPEGVAFE
jgi:hypothetical protein